MVRSRSILGTTLPAKYQPDMQGFAVHLNHITKLERGF